MKKFFKLTLILLIVLCSTFSMCACSNKKTVKPTYSEMENSMIFENWSYGKYGERNLLDLGLPKNVDSCGLILYIHGGGWTGGNKDGNIENIKDWNKKGYACAAINYRYIDKYTDCNDLLDDISLSLQKIKEMAKEKSINVDKVVLMGGSAGAHLSLLYGYTKKSIAPIEPVGVVSLSGPTDLLDGFYYSESAIHKASYQKWFPYLVGQNFKFSDKEKYTSLIKQVSPVYFVNANTIPTIICHGTKDDIVPISNAEALKLKLDEFGVLNHYIVFENSGHGLESDSDKTLLFNQLLNIFIENYL